METNVSTVIVVTGASRGIGKAIALSLAAPDTALIINCSKSAGRLELVKEEIIKKGALPRGRALFGKNYRLLSGQ